MENSEKISNKDVTKSFIKFNHELQTSYDPIKKIWSGANYRGYYDENCSIGRIIYEEMRKNPKHICQISDSEQTQLTNEEVLLQAAKISKYFESLGIKQTDIISIAARNTTYLLGLVLACFFRGTAFQGISYNSTQETIKQLLNTTKPKVIFCDADILDKIQYAVCDWSSDVTVITLNDSVVGKTSIKDLLEPSLQDVYFHPSDLENGPNQTLCILSSSGSTGIPKAVTISNNTRMFEYANYFTNEDVQFVASNVEWISWLLSTLCSLVYGAKRIICNRPASPKYFLEIVQKYKVTFVFQTPSSVRALINYEDTTPEKLDSIRYFNIGGEKCNVETLRKMQSLLKNGRIVFDYAFTELGAIMTKNSNFETKLNSVGRLFPGFHVKIINDNGQALDANEVGEVLIHHGKTWNGYYNNREATREMQDAGGWFHSGDLGYFDKDNYLYIVDRKKNLLKFRSMLYMPNEVEEMIAKIPQVLDVCVFGVWSEADGDAAAAAVLVKRGSTLTAEEVVAYVRKNTTDYHKQLHGGAVIWDEFPKTACAKVDSLKVKQIFIEHHVKKS